MLDYSKDITTRELDDYITKANKLRSKALYDGISYIARSTALVVSRVISQLGHVHLPKFRT